MFGVTFATAVRLFLIFLPVPLCIYYWYKRLPYVRRVNKIPGPTPLPVIGNALHFLKSPAELFLDTYNDLAKYGRVFRFWILHQPMVVIHSAKDAERVLPDTQHQTKSINYRFLEPYMGSGLITANYNDKWRVHRKVLTPAFHFNILNEFLPTLAKHSVKMTQCLDQEPEKTSDQGFDILHYASRCSLDIICESSMGTKLHAQDNVESSYLEAILNSEALLVHRYFSAWLRLDSLYALSPTRRQMDRNYLILNAYTDDVIKERREYLKSINFSSDILSGNNKNAEGQRRRLAFLDLLLAAELEGSDYMTNKDIRDQVSTFMSAGFDTVSTAVSWALFIIGAHPEVQALVVEELESVFGTSGRVPDLSDMSELKYLDRVLKEVMRLYPSVCFFERQLTHDAHLENFVVPAGCTLTTNVYMIHRDPEFWPDPDKFDPDRFLPENSKGRNPYAFIPFSAGPRNCIGQKFAWLENKMVVSTILRRFRVEAAQKLEDIKLQIGIVLHPADGIRIRIYDRETHPKLRISQEISA